MEAYYNFPLPFSGKCPEHLTFSTSTIRGTTGPGDRSWCPECGGMLNSESTASGKTVSI
jgi:hypothetical protein